MTIKHAATMLLLCTFMQAQDAQPETLSKPFITAARPAIRALDRMADQFESYKLAATSCFRSERISWRSN
jgi:hypothetical protein